MKGKKILASFLAAAIGSFSVITPVAAENFSVSSSDGVGYQIRTEKPTLPDGALADQLEAVSIEAEKTETENDVAQFLAVSEETENLLQEKKPTLPDGALARHMEAISAKTDTAIDTDSAPVRFLASSANDKTLSYMKINLSCYYSDYEAKFTEMDKAADKIIAMVDPTWDDLSKIVFINDYITSHCSYDLTYEKYCAYDCLVGNSAVCMGYAEAFWYLMYKMGIDCKIISSTQVNHAWNLVKVDGLWYNVDTTWNDPIPDSKSYSKHTELLLSDTACSKTGHAASDWKFFYEGGASASGYATSTKYDNYFWQDVKTPFAIRNNIFYGINSTGIIKGDKYNNASLIRSLSTFTWPVWNGSLGAHWIGIFSGLQTYGDKLIYNDSLNIYTCDYDGSNQTVLYSLTSAESSVGYIYGVLLDGSSLKYYIAQNSGYGDNFVEKSIRIDQKIAPSIPTVKTAAGDGKVTLSWNSVSGATKYRVFYRINGTSSWAYKDTTATSYTVSGLTNGKKYDFLVLAYNGTKWSTYTNSNIVYATPVSSTPALPTVKAAAGNASVALSWNSVSGAVKYRVFYRLNGTSSWTYKDTTSTSYTVSGLTNGKKYDFLVLAGSTKAWSKWTNSNIIYATPSGSAVPALPTVKAAPGNTKVTLTWNSVSGAVKYRVFYRLNGTSSWTSKDTTATSYTVSGLTNGKKYDFLVLAGSTKAWSKWTNSNIIYAAPSASSVPALPTVKATAGNASVALSWNSVSGAVKYRVFYRVNGTSSWTSKDTTATSYTISGLTNGKKYDLLVLAGSTNAWSKWTNSNIIYATPSASAAPALPTVKATAGNLKVDLSWNAVTGAKKYRVFYRLNGTSSWTYKETTSTSYTVSNLTSGRKYDFLVLAYNGKSWSKYTTSDIVYATPVYYHFYVVNTGRSSSAVLNWYAAEGAVKYRVYYRLSGTTTWTTRDTTATGYTITGLTNGNTYDFLVLSYNGYSWSKYTSNSIVTAKIYAASSDYGIVTFPKEVYVYDSEAEEWLNTGYGSVYGAKLWIGMDISDYVDHAVLVNGTELTLYENGDGYWFNNSYIVYSDDVVIRVIDSPWSAARLSDYAVMDKDSSIKVYYYNNSAGKISNLNRPIQNGEYVPKDSMICIRIPKSAYSTRPNIYINGVLVYCELNADNEWQIWGYDVPDGSNTLSIHVK